MSHAQWNAKKSSVRQNDGLIVRIASCRRPEQTDKEFRQTCSWLRFAGRAPESDRAPALHQQEIDALCRYMDVQRGLCDSAWITSNKKQSFWNEGRFYKRLNGDNWRSRGPA